LECGTPLSYQGFQRRKGSRLLSFRFSSEVTADDAEKSLKKLISLKKLVWIRLETKFNTYSSFHVSVIDDEFPLINDIDVWPTGCLIAPSYGKLTPHQVY
jgi:hypothetical protein